MELKFEFFNEPTIGTYVQLHDIYEDNIIPEHTHDFYEIIIVIAGGVIHAVNDCEQPLKVGDIVFTRPADKHFYKESFHASVINIAFTAEVMHGFELILNPARFIRLLGEPIPVVKSVGEVVSNRLLSEVKNTYALERNNLKWEVALKDIIYRLFCYGITEENGGSEPSWLTELMKQMEKPQNFVVGCKRLYEIAGRTPEHVSRQIKIHLNLTPTAYINGLRMNYAMNQLILTSNSIMDICFNAGFDNLAYFYRLFKHETGISPLKYRNLNKVKII
jgi:AraC family cel operon transcriptional repressor